MFTSVLGAFSRPFQRTPFINHGRLFSQTSSNTFYDKYFATAFEKRLSEVEQDADDSDVEISRITKRLDSQEESIKRLQKTVDHLLQKRNTYDTFAFHENKDN